MWCACCSRFPEFFHRLNMFYCLPQLSKRRSRGDVAFPFRGDYKSIHIRFHNLNMSGYAPALRIFQNRWRDKMCCLSSSPSLVQTTLPSSILHKLFSSIKISYSPKQHRNCQMSVSFWSFRQITPIPNSCTQPLAVNGEEGHVCAVEEEACFRCLHENFDFFCGRSKDEKTGYTCLRLS
jgi:hypothetical protein